MSSIWVTIKKELRSIFRDRKTLITLLVFPLLIPVMIFLYVYLYESYDDETKYLIGINYTLNEVEESLMKELNLDYKVYNNVIEMEEAYGKDEIIGYIDYNRLDDKYYLYINEDSDDGMYATGYVTSYLNNYNDYLAKVYLINNNIDVDKAYNNISYEIIDLDGENYVLLMIFSVAFTYIIMAIVMATTNMATAATAVEKENGTMETILTFPIRVRDLIVGKYLATVVMGFVSALIGLILTLVSLGVATNSFDLFKEFNFSISVGSVLLSVLIIILASLFIAGLSLAVTSFTKSYKEAQSMCSMLNILTVIPMFISLLNIEISRGYYFIPILNYTQLLMDIFSNNIDILTIIMVIVSSIVYVVLVISYILVQYRNEKVLFS